MRGHMDCIIFSEACLLSYRLGLTTWYGQEARSQVAWQEGPCTTLAGGNPEVMLKKSLTQISGCLGSSAF